jgi:hypothetical protein
MKSSSRFSVTGCGMTFKNPIQMFSHRRFLWEAVAISIFCSGCIPLPGGVTTKLNYYASADDDNVAKRLTPPTGKSIVYVLQEFSVLGQNQLETVVQLDQRAVRTLAPRTYYMEVVEPGKHKLGIRAYLNAPLATGGGAMKPLGKDLIIELEPNHAYFFETMLRSSVTALGFNVVNIEFNRMDEAPARNLLKTYRLSSSYPVSP